MQLMALYYMINQGYTTTETPSDYAQYKEDLEQLLTHCLAISKKQNFNELYDLTGHFFSLGEMQVFKNRSIEELCKLRNPTILSTLWKYLKTGWTKFNKFYAKHENVFIVLGLIGAVCLCVGLSMGTFGGGPIAMVLTACLIPGVRMCAVVAFQKLLNTAFGRLPVVQNKHL